MTAVTICNDFAAQENKVCHCSHCFPICADVLSRGCLFATPWTVARHVPLSMEFSRQEYWSGVPLPSPNVNLGPFKKLSHLYMTTGKTIALTVRIFVSKVKSLLSNTLARFVIAFFQGAIVF